MSASKPILKFKLLRVSTRDAVTKVNNSDFTVDLSSTIHPAVVKCHGVALQEVSFKNFNFNVRGGTFSFIENGHPRQDIPIPPGQYNLSQLESRLQAEIQGRLVTATSVSVAENPTTRRLEVTVNGNTLSVLVDATTESFTRDILGYSSTTTDGFTAIADYSVDLSGPEHAYIECREISNNHLIDPVFGRRNVLRVIPITETYGSTVLWSSDDSSDIVMYSGPRQLSRLRFRLTNASGDLLEVGDTSIKMILKLYYYK